MQLCEHDEPEKFCGLCNWPELRMQGSEEFPATAGVIGPFTAAQWERWRLLRAALCSLSLMASRS